MERRERQAKIIDYLRVKSVNHGQVETCLLRLSDEASADLDEERRESLKRSLQEQGTNLIPLLVRRVEPDEDDREYEVVFGADWFLVAEELGVDRLWVWVFDLDPEQAAIAYEEMERLMGGPGSEPHPIPSPKPTPPVPATASTSPSIDEIADLIDRKLKPVTDSIADISKPEPTPVSGGSFGTVFEQVVYQIRDELKKGTLQLSISNITLGAPKSKPEPSASRLPLTGITDLEKLAAKYSRETNRELYKCAKETLQLPGVTSKMKKGELIEQIMKWHREQG